LYESAAGLLTAYQRDARELMPLLLHAARTLSLRAALALIVLGLADLGVQQLLRLRRLRMTRRQLLDEQREAAGDPQQRNERRARSSSAFDPQLKAALQAQLSTASLVLTGAGRVVAVRAPKEQGAAQLLWLRAEGVNALELVASAYAQGLPIATDDALTAELFRLPVQQAIPDSASARVAELLATTSLNSRTNPRE
jgi:type III secretory pathway component EscU